MGTDLFTETSENLHILTPLSARENFIEFVAAKASRLTTSGYIREESFKSYALK